MTEYINIPQTITEPLFCKLVVEDGNVIELPGVEKIGFVKVLVGNVVTTEFIAYCTGSDTVDQEQLPIGLKLTAIYTNTCHIVKWEMYERKVNVVDGRRMVQLTFIRQEDHVLRYSG